MEPDKATEIENKFRKNCFLVKWRRRVLGLSFGL
jgi:hypothetical protein